MLCKNVPEEVSVGVVNGKITLSSASQTAARAGTGGQRQADDQPGCCGGFTEVRLHSGQRYDLLPAVPLGSGIRRCILNGKLAVYPDDAVLLPGSSIKLDNTFLLRAQSRLYWNEHRFLAVDPRLDTAALAAKGCSFSAPRPSCAQALRPFWPRSSRIPPS